MNPERWQQVRKLPDHALALEGSEHAALLDAAQMRAQVVALLKVRCKVHPGVFVARGVLGEGVNRLGDYSWYADVSAAQQT
jgi:hypothetical protein